MIALSIGIAGVTPLFSQDLIYSEKHKEVEYNYAIIDQGVFDKLSETEKIKYELRYSEKSVTRKISADYTEELEIVYDSNGYTKDWLKLPKRVVYNNSGMRLYDKYGDLMNTLSYSDDQLIERANDQIDLQQNGYHPGLVSFPEGSPSLFDQLKVNGINYRDYGSGKFSIIDDGVTTTYDKENLLITTERIDEVGNKCKDYDGYTQMENGRGYLQVLSKTETAITSLNGPCLTAVKLVYYFDYKIEDFANLINKSLDQIKETVLLYPNPNQGVFSIQVVLNQGNVVKQIRILNMLTGKIIDIPNGNTNNVNVSMPDLEPGFYAVQVINNNSILTSQFIKQ